MRNKKIAGKVIRTVIYEVFILLMIFPIFVMINTSLKTYNEITMWPPKWIGFTPQFVNYKDVLTGDKSIVEPFMNSLIVSLGSSIVCLFLGVLSSYGVTRFNFKGRGAFLFVIIATQMFASVILVNPMYIVFKTLDILNTRLALIIANISTCLPMTVWLLYSYMSKIPLDLEEAAMIDGCSRSMAVRKVLLPIMIPGMVSAGLFSFIMAWGDLIYAKTFIFAPNLRTISLALTDFQSLYKTTWETQMAAGVISVIPILILFLIIQKHLVNGMISSGLKE